MTKCFRKLIRYFSQLESSVCLLDNVQLCTFVNLLHVSIEMGVFKVGAGAENALIVLLACVCFQMTVEVRFLVEFFVAQLALELGLTVINLMRLHPVFSSEHLSTDSTRVRLCFMSILMPCQMPLVSKFCAVIKESKKKVMGYSKDINKSHSLALVALKLPSIIGMCFLVAS